MNDSARATIQTHRENPRVTRTIRLALLLAFVLCAALPALAQQGTAPQASQYTLGDQTMSINAGTFIPLFLIPSGVWFLASNDATGGSSHLSVGAVGSLSWAAYVAPQWRVGVEIGGSFGLSPNSNTLLLLPILAKASYVLTFYPFEVPLTLAVGMDILKYVDDVTIDPLIRPGVGFYWILDSSWSFGGNLNYWFDTQFSSISASQTRVGNFLEVTLGALYHY